ncbi:MAG: CHRD domain-containing protein [Chloroflexota bacterium]
MRHLTLPLIVALTIVLGSFTPAANAEDPHAPRRPPPSPGTGAFDGHRVVARLSGFQEVPAISTTGFGTFKATWTDPITDPPSINFELKYEALEGGTPTAAHIHFGQYSVNGGISVFLCGGSKPACPAGPATVTGSFAAADVVGPTGQGIAAGELRELVKAIRAGVAYVNVHTPTYPSGEIRGQIRRLDDHRGSDDD